MSVVRLPGGATHYGHCNSSTRVPPHRSAGARRPAAAHALTDHVSPQVRGGMRPVTEVGRST